MIRMQICSLLRQEPSQHAGGPDIPELLYGKLPIYILDLFSDLSLAKYRFRAVPRDFPSSRR